MAMMHNPLLKKAVVCLLFLFPVGCNGHSFLTLSGDSFPYHVTFKNESWWAGGAIATGATGFWLNRNQRALNVNDYFFIGPEDVNGFDRQAVYQHSEDAAIGSDVSGGILVGTTLVTTLAYKRPFNERFKVLVMYGEAITINSGIGWIVKNTVDRRRPLLYNPDLTVAQKEEGGSDNLRSFYSGHTSMAFCSAVFFSSTFSTLHPDSKAKPWIWGGSLLAAGTTGYLRYKAGLHFPTDLIAGAGIGSLIGWAVPRLHRRKEKNDALGFHLYPRNFGQLNGLSLVVNF